MPHRVMTIEGVADFLHVTVEDVADLVQRREIPFEQQGRRTVFRKLEVDEWASQRILGLSGKRLERYHQGSTKGAMSLDATAAIIGEMLPEKFIDPEFYAKTRAAVIRDVAALAGETGLVTDAVVLAAQLRAREDLFSTAMPGGFALLHARQHDPYMFDRSFLMLARTPQPIPFGAQDGGLTDLFFLICCLEDRLHLHVLARLSMMCAKTDLLVGLRIAANAREMAECITAAEAEVLQSLKTV